MEFSTNAAQDALPDEVVDDRMRALLAQLDDQDFTILKMLETRGSLDAIQVAGGARLRPGGVLTALTKLDRLGLVNAEETSSSSPYETRFVFSGGNSLHLSSE